MYQGGGNLKNPDKVLALCCYSPVCWELRSFIWSHFAEACTIPLRRASMMCTLSVWQISENCWAIRYFLQAVGNTLRFLALGVPLLLSLALLVSVIGVKAKLYRQRWALLLPMVIPASSLSVAWQGLWGEAGLLNRALALLGIPAVDFLRGGAAFPLLLVLYLLKNVGYVSVILMSAIRAISPEYQECYRLDSSSEAGFVRRILLPLISPTILFACIVAVMNYFLLFRDTYMLYMENPPAQVYMLQHFMNSNFYKLNYQRLGTAAFLVVLTLTALICGILFVQRRVKRHVG